MEKKSANEENLNRRLTLSCYFMRDWEQENIIS